jgi:hypothetical protein
MVTTCVIYLGAADSNPEVVISVREPTRLLRLYLQMIHDLFLTRDCRRVPVNR